MWLRARLAQPPLAGAPHRRCGSYWPGRAHHPRRHGVRGSGPALPALAAVAAGDEEARSHLAAEGGPHEWAPVAAALHRRLPRRMAARFLPEVDCVTAAVAAAPSGGGVGEAGAAGAAAAMAAMRVVRALHP